ATSREASVIVWLQFRSVADVGRTTPNLKPAVDARDAVDAVALARATVATAAASRNDRSLRVTASSPPGCRCGGRLSLTRKWIHFQACAPATDPVCARSSGCQGHILPRSGSTLLTAFAEVCEGGVYAGRG